MSLLDAARRLAEIPPEWDEGEQSWVCSGCNTVVGPFIDSERDADAGHESFVHEEHCPWLALPRIVAVLEAAETVVDATTFVAHDPLDERPDAHQLACKSCGEDMLCDCTEAECDDIEPWAAAMMRNYRRIVHQSDCVAQALIMALRPADGPSSPNLG